MKQLLIGRLPFLLAGLFLIAQQASAQSWQWGRRGGGSFAEGMVGGQEEEVTDIASDAAGNVYVLSQVFFNYNSTVTVDTHQIDIDSISRSSVLSSFTCDGRFRWAKAFGNQQGGDPAALECDTLGGVYVAINHSHHNWYEPLVIDVDTHLTWYSYKRMQLLKYDTAGNFQWIREPQADTITGFQYWTHGLDLSVDGGGNIWFYSFMAPGAYFDNAMSVPEKGLYVTHLDKDANFISTSRLNVDIAGTGNCCGPFEVGSGKAWMMRNHKTGMIYVGGSRGYGTDDTTHRFSVGGTPVKDGQGIFIASFSPDGSANWLRGNKDTLQGHATNCGLSRASLDAAGNLYFTGSTSRGDTVAGMPVVNPASNFPISSVIVFKLDSAGNGRWLTNSINKYSVYGGVSGGAMHGDRYLAGAGHSHWVTWPGLGDTITKAADGFMHIFVSSFDTATGQIIAVDSLVPTFTVKSDLVTSMHTDRFGNTYVGGQMEHTLIVGSDTLQEQPFGDKDFFIAQYGTGHCSAPLDTPSTAIRTESFATGGLQIFPNPAGDVLYLDSGLERDDYTITTAEARVVLQGRISAGRAVADLRVLAPGLYFVRTGSGAVRRFVKQ